MRRHQGIQLLYSGALKRITALPGKNLLTQPLAPLSHRFRGPAGAQRAAPLLAQGRGLKRTQKTGLPEPGQERGKVPEQLSELPSHKGARINEVQGQLVTEEE